MQLYIELSQAKLEYILGYSLKNINEARTFKTRLGYRTVFTGVFTSISSVKIDGVDVTYTMSQGDNLNGDWFNSIILDDPERTEREIVITAEWGFAEMPNDLQLLLGQQFAQTSKIYESKAIKSKSIEDYSVTYADDTDKFTQDNQFILNKYILDIGYIRSGDVCGFQSY